MVKCNTRPVKKTQKQINMNPTNRQIVNQRRPVVPMVKPNGQNSMVVNGNGNGKEIIETPTVQIIQGDVTPEMQTFLSVLSQNPDERQVRTNQYANNSEYLPIQYLEAMLDTIFNGKWNLRHKGTQFIGNAITCDVELEVYFPDGTEIVRAGSGSSIVQVDAQTGEFKPKSVEKAYGSALSMAFKNSTKRLGNIFGRMLNREDEVIDYYKTNYANQKFVNQ
jgi:hypothetical protein